MIFEVTGGAAILLMFVAIIVTLGIGYAFFLLIKHNMAK